MPLNDAQVDFLALHIRYVVERWQWVFADGMLRAFAPRARCASVSRAELDDLVQRGLVERGPGQTVRVTDAGKVFANGG
jgi:hypothetical protein